LIQFKRRDALANKDRRPENQPLAGRPESAPRRRFWCFLKVVM
jgi:hypothetical protein